MKDKRAQIEIQTAIDESVTSGAEIGLQVAVMKDGRVVVDVVSGVADPRTVAVSRDTLFYAASTAKGVATSVAHVLVERGKLDYDMRAVDVWPDFGTHGKDKVTLRHVLLHTAGVPGLPSDTTVDDLCNWAHMCAVLADERPWWEPGTRFGYHAQTFGFLLGEIMRRATGRTISTLLRDVVTGPLGTEDEVHFGVPQPLLARVARQVAPDGPAPNLPEPGSPLDRAMPRGILPDAEYANRSDVLTSDIPSAGTMTARGVARKYSALLGHVDGVALVSSRRLATMAVIAFTGIDEVIGFPIKWAFGYSPGRPGGVPSRPGSTFGVAPRLDVRDGRDERLRGLCGHRFRCCGGRDAQSFRRRSDDGGADRPNRRRDAVVNRTGSPYFGVHRLETPSVGGRTPPATNWRAAFHHRRTLEKEYVDERTSD